MKTLKNLYKQKNKISMITCYDYLSAKIISETNIDLVLVGDSAAMVIHGYETTIPADIKMMETHVAAVSRGLSEQPLIADMPFLSHKKGIHITMASVERLIKAGGNAVKIEGADDSLKIIEYIVRSGIPVMGHLGMTPQSVNQLGGWKVQGKTNKIAKKIISDAKSLESAGVFSIVLEMIPSDLAKTVTDSIKIPTIGIGAGPNTSGQVLVYHDLLGLNPEFKPKFLKTYFNGFDNIKKSIIKYSNEVKNGKFPTQKESF
tara:strand:+ start:245 stop:1024 length:780 start_codon:yes stop_codon:yes gene_type:complete